MSLTDIKAKIESDARFEAEKNLAAAQEQVEAIKRETEEEIRRMGETQKGRLAKEVSEILRRREIVANLDVSREDLSARRGLIDECFALAKEKMAAMDEAKVIRFAEILLDKAIETKDETLFVGRKEKVLNAEWLEGYNREHDTKLKLAEDRLPIVGGFVLRCGRVDVNCSWGMLLRAAREDLEAETVKRLFTN